MAEQRLDEQNRTGVGGDAPARIGLWGRIHQWMRAHHMTLMNLPDTPHSIALGAAIGMFFGFTPLFTMKTLLAFAITWLCRANKTAAIITVTLHDILLPRRARHVLLAISTRDVGALSPRPATRGISPRCPGGLHGVDHIPHRGPTHSGRLAFLRGPGRVSRLFRPARRPYSLAGQTVGICFRRSQVGHSLTE